MPSPRTAAEYLAARVDELDGLWLELVCSACGAKSYPPFKMLARRLGAKRVDEITPRFRCERCGARPGHVAIVSYPAHGTPQYPDAWAVELVDKSAG